MLLGVPANPGAIQNMAVDTAVSYDLVENFPGWAEAPQFLIEKIKLTGAKSVLEIGSGANPTLSLKEVESLGVAYTTNDIDARELEKAPKGFKTWQQDMCGVIPDDHMGQYDLVFSRMVNEHVPDGRKYYGNIYKVLSPGGSTVHCFSTLYTLPFLVNKYIPEWVSSHLLTFFAPRTTEQHGKFRAHYSWSRGPTKVQIRKFESLGFTVGSYIGYFGHSYYNKRLKLLKNLEQKKSRYLLSRGRDPLLTAYAVVELRKT